MRHNILDQPFSMGDFSLHASSILLGLLGVFIVGITYTIGYFIYNAYFHPLAKYPGPKSWAASPIPFVYYTFTGRLPFEIMKLHTTYGEVVRVLPGELSYDTAEAWKDIYPHHAGRPQMVKDRKFYVSTFDAPNEHIQHVADSQPTQHSRFRRLLAHGFSDQSLRGQESLIDKYISLLMTRLHENSGAPVNLSRWYNYCSFDIIGDLVFGDSFNCLTNSDYHPWVSMIWDNMKGSALLPGVKRIPGVPTLLHAFIPKKILDNKKAHNDMTAAMVQKRLEKKEGRPDILSHVVGLMGNERGMSRLELEANANILIIAGSETTASALAGATYYICRYPEVKAKLIHEIRSTFAKESDINFSNVNSLTYMIAVLTETLRIYPVVPTGLPRVVQEGGEVVNGRWVPGGAVVSSHSVATSWNPANFFEPLIFHPERWLGDPRFKNDKLNASQPFSLGPRNCIGKNLAIAELRTIFARMIWNFDIELTESSQNWIDQRTFIVWERGPLDVKLTPVIRS